MEKLGPCVPVVTLLQPDMPHTPLFQVPPPMHNSNFMLAWTLLLPA